ncbi:hypothetical protein J28TS4_40320 [Paenibacillus lautus]|nr:hypothetical protein J28TS4_40320 [Paenibacillus lautus]
MNDSTDNAGVQAIRCSEGATLVATVSGSTPFGKMDKGIKLGTLNSETPNCPPASKIACFGDRSDRLFHKTP